MLEGGNDTVIFFMKMNEVHNRMFKLTDLMTVFVARISHVGELTWCECEILLQGPDCVALLVLLLESVQM